MKLTRRNLATVLASAAVATAQQPVPAALPAVLPDDDLTKAARDRMRANAAALGQPPVPMATEPAFQFKV